MILKCDAAHGHPPDEELCRQRQMRTQVSADRLYHLRPVKSQFVGMAKRVGDLIDDAPEYDLLPAVAHPVRLRMNAFTRSIAGLA